MTILKNINTLYNKNKKNVKKSSSIKQFVLKVGNNRVLDIYLKYLGITALNTNTLIPLAFILGAKTFDKVVKDMISKDQKGGNILDKKLPILDDAAIGMYLKLTGLTSIPLSPYTLVPLGVLMVLYSKLIQKGGSVNKNININNMVYNSNNNRIESNQAGGSDWKMTQYSRGPGNSNLTTPEIHSQFNKSSPYISNNDLKIGAYYDNVPKTLTTEPISTTNEPMRLSAELFGGKRRKRKNNKKKLTKSKRRNLKKTKGKKGKSNRRTRRRNRRNRRN
tara:strand:+ start:805 stop:1635 length:831 start_codon:yes stop_codon:yes gene_type:complete